MDLNEEAIEICRLSLWIKTAQRGKVLTSLDHTIRVGNSVVDDPAGPSQGVRLAGGVSRSVCRDGGFDVVVGQSAVRPAGIAAARSSRTCRRHYRTYHGMADLYVYFYELGLRLLKPGGRLSFIVTNKWMKAGYGEPLRRFFAEQAWIESVVDFGHAKQIFEDADVFPSIIVARRPTDERRSRRRRGCVRSPASNCGSTT